MATADSTSVKVKHKKKKGVGFAAAVSKEEEKEDPEVKLLKLLRFAPLRGRHGMQQCLKKHEKFIRNLASNKDDDSTSNVQRNIDLPQFIAMFDGKIGKKLCTEMFAMIDADLDDSIEVNTGGGNDDDQKATAKVKYISQFDIIKFMEGTHKNKHVRALTIKDADWVLEHLKDVQFADLDKDSDGKVVIEDFYTHFGPLGLTKQRILLMFQMLDKNDDKKISIFEYNAWRSKQTATDLQNILNQLTFD